MRILQPQNLQRCATSKHQLCLEVDQDLHSSTQGFVGDKFVQRAVGHLLGYPFRVAHSRVTPPYSCLQFRVDPLTFRAAPFRTRGYVWCGSLRGAYDVPCTLVAELCQAGTCQRFHTRGRDQRLEVEAYDVPLTLVAELCQAGTCRVSRTTAQCQRSHLLWTL